MASEVLGLDLTWPRTEGEAVAQVRCVCQANPDLLRTSATRFCSAGGVWQQPNDEPCRLSPATLRICNVSCLYVYSVHTACRCCVVMKCNLLQQGSVNADELLDDVNEAASEPSTLTSADVGIITNVLEDVSVGALQNETVSVEWL